MRAGSPVSVLHKSIRSQPVAGATCPWFIRRHPTLPTRELTFCVPALRQRAQRSAARRTSAGMASVQAGHALALYRRLLRTARTWTGSQEVRHAALCLAGTQRAGLLIVPAGLVQRALRLDAGQQPCAPWTAQERDYIRSTAKEGFRRDRHLAPADAAAKVCGGPACTHAPAAPLWPRTQRTAGVVRRVPWTASPVHRPPRPRWQTLSSSSRSRFTTGSPTPACTTRPRCSSGGRT